MPATDIAGLDVIRAWAPLVSVDVTDTVDKARMLMQTDPAALRSGGDRLTSVASGLNGGGQDLRLAGSTVLDGWSGQAANSFGPHQTRLVNQVSGNVDASRTLAADLGRIASVFEQGQNTVVTATGATATALRMLGTQP